MKEEDRATRPRVREGLQLEEGQQEQPYDDCRLDGGQIVDQSPASNRECGTPLRWGGRKQSRSSRLQTRNPGSRADNCHVKPNGTAGESSVLNCKAMHIQPERPWRGEAVTSFLASESTLEAESGMLADGRQNLQVRALEGGLGDPIHGAEGSHVWEDKRGHLVQPTKPCTMADPNFPSPDQCDTSVPAGSSDAIGLSKNKNGLIWPNVVVQLSRIEKQEDFLLIKGTRLPQRPKHRSQGVKRALSYCSPGSLLANISQSRYEVKERKRCKKIL